MVDHDTAVHVQRLSELLGFKLQHIGTRNSSAIVHSRDAQFSEAVRRDVNCALQHSQAGMGEDLLLLPTLLLHAAMKPGVFIEHGAADGLTGSNTYMLERCFAWKGLLIEASPTNFAVMRQRSQRRAVMVHSSVCRHERTIPFSRWGGLMSARVDAMSPSFSKRAAKVQKADREDAIVNVSCKPLAALMDEAGFAHANYFSLDVEGAEDIVLEGSDLSRIDLVETEALPKMSLGAATLTLEDPDKDRRVEELLAKARFRLSELHLSWGRVFVSPAVRQVLPAAGAPLRGALPQSGNDPFFSHFSRFHSKLAIATGTPRRWLQHG